MQLLHSFFVSKIDEHASKASARERDPCSNGQKSPAAFIFIREIDDLQGENRSTISNEKVEGLLTGYEGACYILVNSLQEVSGDYANVVKSLL